MQSTVNDPDLWIKSIWWTSIFPRGRPILNSEINYWTFFESMWHGAPNETQSDYCIVTIIRNSRENGECQIPATCKEILLKDDCATGYGLTHRLLMIQVARAVRCCLMEEFKIFCINFIIYKTYTACEKKGRLE